MNDRKASGLHLKQTPQLPGGVGPAAPNTCFPKGAGVLAEASPCLPPSTWGPGIQVQVEAGSAVRSSFKCRFDFLQCRVWNTN